MNTSGFANRTIMLRIAIAVLAFLLGHDAIMALNPHGEDTQASAYGHHALAIEQCGVADGNVHQSNHIPISAHLASHSVIQFSGWFDAGSITGFASAAPAPDTVLMRISHQVFLN